MPRSALQDVKIVEYASFVAGPYCAKLLADMGAEVVKVEPPEGDLARSYGPYPGNEPDREKSGLFLYLNTNKLGVTCDLSSASGREQLRGLLADADVFIHDLTPARAGRLGLDFDRLQDLNKRLVVTAVTPYGSSGPKAEVPAHELNLCQAGGEGFLLPGGLGHRMYPNAPPVRLGGHAGDYDAGVASAVGTMSALLGRDVHGKGQFVDVSRQEANLSLNRVTMVTYESEGLVNSRANRFYKFGGLFPTKDGYVVLRPTEDKHWAALAQIMGRPALATDRRFAGRQERIRNGAKCNAVIAEWAATQTKRAIHDACYEGGCPVGPFNDAKEIAEDPQMKSRGFLQEVDHPVAGRWPYPSAPYRFPKTPWKISRPAPVLGEHNRLLPEVAQGAAAGEIPAPLKREPVPIGPLQTKQALAGVRILDLSWAASGPLSTLYLSLLGAEVIKIESVRSLDIARRGYYTLVDDIDASPNFNDMHLGKLSIRVDMRHPKAKDLVLRLASVCDAAVENFRPGTLDRFGLSYETLRQARPDLLMVSSSTAGQTGPEHAMPGYATTFGALGGLGTITGHKNGPATEIWDSVDMRLGTSIAVATLIGLFDRWRSGEGQHVDFSSREVISATIGDTLMAYFMTGEVAQPKGNEDEVMAPHNCYPCRGEDQWVSIAVSSEAEWRALCLIAGTVWHEDERFADMARRRCNREALDTLIGEWTLDQDATDLAARLQEAGVPAAESLDAPSLFGDRHLADRGVFLEVDHPKLGLTHPVRPPFTLSETPVGPARYGPMFGEHVEYVFGEIVGLSAGELKALADEGVFN